MKIFYSCFGGAHSSVTAAAIHMGYLPSDRLPTIREILTVPFYDKAENHQIGLANFMGIDAGQCEIYFLGLGHARDYYTGILYEFINEINLHKKNEIIVIDVTPLLNSRTRLGGFMSRRLNIVNIGRPLTAYGILKNYSNFIGLVKNVQTAFQ